MKGVMSRCEAIQSSWLFAAVLVGVCIFHSYGQVTCADIRLHPSQYVGRQVILAGTFYSKNAAKKSFYLKQGNETMEVLCERLASAQQSLVWSEKNISGTPVIVYGTVQRRSNKENSCCVLAVDVSILQGLLVAPDQLGAGLQGLSEGPTALGPGQRRSGLSPSSPVLSRAARQKSNDSPPGRQEDSGARRAANEDIHQILWPLLGVLVLLTTTWVGFDARANKITSRKGAYCLHNGALAWVGACLLLWIIVFPYYLVRRSTVFRERAQNLHAPPPSVAVPPVPPGAASVPLGGGGMATTNAAPRAPVMPKPDIPWYYVDTCKTFGPMPEAYIHVLVKAGQLIEHSTLVWQEGMDGWWFYDEVFNKQTLVNRRPVPANAPPLPVSSAGATGLVPPLRQAASTDLRSAKDQPHFVKGACQHCGGHLEFSSLNQGQTIDCPHCKRQTKLVENPASGNTRSLPKGKPLPVGIPIGRQGASTAGPARSG
jgi:hypothetical protein